MAGSVIIRESGRDIALSDVSGQILLSAERDGKHRMFVLSLQVSARADGQDAVFWLRSQGPLVDDRLALQQRFVESDSGGFYFYEHAAVENLAFVAYRENQATWRLLAVADLSGAADSAPRIEIDADLTVVATIDWKCG